MLIVVACNYSLTSIIKIFTLILNNVVFFEFVWKQKSYWKTKKTQISDKSKVNKAVMKATTDTKHIQVTCKLSEL